MENNNVFKALSPLPPVNSLQVSGTTDPQSFMMNTECTNTNENTMMTSTINSTFSTPTNNVANSTSNFSGNDINNLKPKNDQSTLHNDVNTKVACMNCREKKLKCDKLLPMCTRCSKKKCPCIYVEHRKTGPKPQSGIRKSKKVNNTKSISPDIHKPISKTKKQKVIEKEESSYQPPFTPQSSSSLPPIISLPPLNISHSPHQSTYQSQNHAQQSPYLYSEQSQTRLSVDQFMNPLSYSQPLVQKSTTDLRTHNTNTTTTPNNNNNSKNNNTGENNNTSKNNSTNNNSNRSHINDNKDVGLAHSNHTSQNLYSPSITPSNNSSPNSGFNREQVTQLSNNHVLSRNRQHLDKKNPLCDHLNQGKAKSQNFNTNLTNLTNRSFEAVIGLPSLNLKMQDIDKFHSFYFDSSTRIFKYSIQRYYNTFVKDPKSILHYSYMIWTMACFYLNEYEYMVETMYKTALVQMSNYWESNRDSFHSDILTYLHALCLKSQFEFLSGREMRAALTIASSIRLTQMYGYDQIDLSPTTLGSPAIFFRSFSVNSEQFESTNTLLQDDNLDPDIPLVEERRRVLWEVFAIDKWSSLVTGLPCALSVDSLSVIFTKLPSPTTFLPLNNDSDISEQDNEQSSYYLHEAMQKLDNNQVLLDINSSSSKILLLTISENIIKWCKMFLNMVELETLKNPSSIDSIRNKVDELVRNFESMHNNLLFFDLTTEPLMNIVITNTSTLLYQSVLIKFGSLFDVQFKEDPTGGSICENEIKLFKDVLYEVSAMSEKLVLRFIKKQHIENHLKKAPVFIVFINSIKSLFQCIAFVYRFNHILHVSEERKNSLLETIKSCATIINRMSVKTPIVEKTKDIINNGQELLDHSPHLLSFFDSFFDSAKTY